MNEFDALGVPENGAKPVSVVSPRETLMKYLPMAPWVIASVLLFMTLAYLRLRYSVNKYNVVSTILVKDPNASSIRADKMDEMLFSQPNRNMNDEIQVISSRAMARRVVKSLGMQISYFSKGKIRSSQIYTHDSPLLLEIISLRDSSSPLTLTLTLIDSNSFRVNGTDVVVPFGETFSTKTGQYRVTRTANSIDVYPTRDFVITYASVDDRAVELVSGLSAEQSGQSNNILQLTYETENTKTGLDVVNQWMDEYIKSGLETKRSIADSALSFIKERMDKVKGDLEEVENNLQNYREKNQVFNPQAQSQEFFVAMSELDKEITTQGVQLQVVDNLIAYISDNANPYKQVGSTLGIVEPSLNQQIIEFNKLQVQRETLLKTTTRANPMVVDVESAIAKLRTDILQNLRNIRSAYQVAQSNLKTRNTQAGNELSKLPSKERDLLEKTRKQKILESLYSFLLQKQLETNISSASTISSVRVIEQAMASVTPVKPNRKATYSIALLLGLLIPFMWIFLKEYFNDRVKGREDVQKGTAAPIIGEVGHSDEKEALVVSRTSRKFIAEQFRIIRTNLQYVLPKDRKPVILVTSSTSGEGKSFISVNVGGVMALAGKKTAIVEFDIRKPRVMASLNLPKRSGITNFIIGKSTFEELPVPVPGMDNLFIIPCGPIPPNPSELIMGEKVDELFARLLEEFDVVVIDTAPVGLVSDAVMLGRHANAALYVVRHEYTFKKQLHLLDDIYKSNRLPHVSLVINDIKAVGGYGRYYGYGSYGYSSYGYGYGSEYFDDKKSSKSFFGSLKRMIGLK